MFSLALRWFPSLAALIPRHRKVAFLLTKFDADAILVYRQDRESDYDNTVVYVNGFNEARPGVALLVEKLDGKIMVGIEAGHDLTEHPKASSLLTEVKDGQFEVHYHFKETIHRYDSLTDAYVSVRAGIPRMMLRLQRKFEPELLDLRRYLDRMTVLQIVTQYTEDSYVNNEISLEDIFDQPEDLPMSVPNLNNQVVLDLLSAEQKADYKSARWPIYARLTHRADMMLASLLESGDLTKGQDGKGIYLAPKAFRTLAEYEVQQARAAETREQYIETRRLRGAAVFVGIVGLLPTVIFPAAEGLWRLALRLVGIAA